MARSIAAIQAQIIATKNSQSALSTLNSPSQVAIWRLWTFVFAVSISLFEQILDIFRTDMEGISNVATAGTPAWIKDQTLKFQYDSLSPQILQVASDFSINYPVVDTTKRIITRCAVVVDNNKTVNIKVAKSEPPVQLTTNEQNALIGFWDTKGAAGVTIVITNKVADKIYIAGTIYYNGQYALTIQQSVIGAINAYLSNLPFNGSIKITALEDAIQSATGVTDLALTDIAIRADSDSFANTIYLIQGATFIRKSVQPSSGYAIEETLSGKLFSDSLIYVVG